MLRVLSESVVVVVLVQSCTVITAPILWDHIHLIRKDYLPVISSDTILHTILRNEKKKSSKNKPFRTDTELFERKKYESKACLQSRQRGRREGSVSSILIGLTMVDVGSVLCLPFSQAGNTFTGLIGDLGIRP